MKGRRRFIAMKKISSTFIIIIVAAATIASIMFASYRNYVSIQENVIQMEQNQLLTLVETVAHSIERFFLNRQRDLEIISKNKAFLEDYGNYKNKKTDNTSWQQLSDYYSINSKQIDNIGIINSKGKSVYAVPYTLDAKYFEADIRAIAKENTDFIGDLYKDHGELYINIYKHIRVENDEGVFLYIRIRLLTLYELLVSPVRAGEKGYVSVKDADGIIIMHPNVSDIGQNVIEIRKEEYPNFDWSELEHLVSEQVKGKSGVGVYHSLWFTDDSEKRVKKFSAYTPAKVGNTFWIVNISKDYLEVVSFLKERTYSIVILNFTILILFASLVMIYFRMNNDRKALVIQKKLSDEVSELNRALEEDIEERKLQEEALRRSEERFRAIVQDVADSMMSLEEEELIKLGSNQDKRRFALELERINIQLEKLFKKELKENQRKEALMIYQSRLAAMGEMIGSIAHQWRQPLSAMHMLFNNLMDAYQHGELDEAMLNAQHERMTKLALHMSQTIDDFRFFFNPNAEADDFLLSTVIDRTLGLLDDTLKQKGIDVELNIISDGLVYGYENQLSQVLLSLLQNSVDALGNSPPFGRKIYISLNNLNGWAGLNVSDTGGGVPQEILNKIFEAYFTTKKQQHGTGLGLYIAKVIVEKNFLGKISALNGEKGLHITLQIPMRGVSKND